ncbi:hypothetical protein FG95_02305 [Sphingopyxis sp. LC363]|nr:hypothetical protein FG95_02305 [Sphingopyxis sp. LC363]
MRQRPAPEPSEREDDKLAVGDAAMRRNEFGDRRIGEHLQRRLGEFGIAARDGERVIRAGDQLHAISEAPLADAVAHAVEQPLIVEPGQPRCPFAEQAGLRRRRLERALVDQPLDQFDPRAKRVGQRRGERQGARRDPGEFGLRREQVKEAHRARQPADELVET